METEDKFKKLSKRLAEVIYEISEEYGKEESFLALLSMVTFMGSEILGEKGFRELLKIRIKEKNLGAK